MKTILSAILIGLLPFAVLASLPLEISMLKVVTESDHVLTVQVIGVDMIGEKGEQITDLGAKTGPGNKNLIRLICEVKETHITNATSVPQVIEIPLDGFMHYSLGQVKEAHEGQSYPMIVVLKGGAFKPAYAGIFRYPMHELETILALSKLKE